MDAQQQRELDGSLSDLSEARVVKGSACISGSGSIAATGEVLTPRQRVDKFFKEIGLGGLDVELVIEAGLFGARPLPKGREQDARRMADLIMGGRLGIDGPLAGAEGLTAEQLEKLEQLRPILRRMMGEAEQRILRAARMEEPPAPRLGDQWSRNRLHRACGRAPRVATNGRVRGGRRCAAGSSGGGDPHQSADDPPDDLSIAVPAGGRR
ncbi:MAG: hypothetical protein AABM66_11965 [Actinomycetota bacterium]